MLNDIYYSRKTNKAIQRIAECRILPEQKKAVCYQELSGDFAVYVVEKTVFQQDFYNQTTYEQVFEDRILREREKDAEPKLQPQKEESKAVSAMMQFLDAETYGEKIKILEGMRYELDDHILNNMAVSLDLSIENGVDGYSFLMSELRIRSRYEAKRGERL